MFIEGHQHMACFVVVYSEQCGVYAVCIEDGDCFRAAFVVTDAADDAGVCAEGLAVAGEIGWRTAEGFCVGNYVPKDFADTGDFGRCAVGGQVDIPMSMIRIGAIIYNGLVKCDLGSR